MCVIFIFVSVCVSASLSVGQFLSVCVCLYVSVWDFLFVSRPACLSFSVCVFVLFFLNSPALSSFETKPANSGSLCLHVSSVGGFLWSAPVPALKDAM